METDNYLIAQLAVNQSAERDCGTPRSAAP